MVTDGRRMIGEFLRGNRSRAWNGIPPETMKMQPRIPPLCPPRLTPVAMTPLWRVSLGEAVNFQGGSFDFGRQATCAQDDSAGGVDGLTD